MGWYITSERLTHHKSARRIPNARGQAANMAYKISIQIIMIVNTTPGGIRLSQHTNVTVTEHKIDKVTYFIYSSASTYAVDTIDEKIKKLIYKDMAKNIEK